MDSKALDTLKVKVERVLEDYPKTRNNDKELVWALWQRFHHITESISKEVYMDLPAESAIIRIRAVIQNDEKKLIPTDWKVAQARGWQEAEWKIHLGYQLDLFDITEKN